MLSTRIENRSLSLLCERVGVAFETGLDPHRVFEREGKGAPASAYSRKMRALAEQIQAGTALSDAVKSQGNYFPPHFADMIEGGEKSGKLDRVLERLAEYYFELSEFRRIFFNSILWPGLQALAAVVVVGLLIYLPAALMPNADPERQDLLGLGLVGERGLIIYAVSVLAVMIALSIGYLLAKNGAFRFLVNGVSRLPWIGRSLRVFAEARFIQTLALNIESGVDAATAVDLAFRCAGTPQFLTRADEASIAIRQGRDMHMVLADTGLFQEETLESIELGEASGRLAETLDKRFRHLKSQVSSSMAKVTYVTSGLVWFLIAAILIFIIFNVFSLYLNGLETRGPELISGDL